MSTITYQCPECKRLVQCGCECYWCVQQAKPKIKKKKIKKPYTIEIKYGGYWAKPFPSWCDWHTYKRYETEEKRDAALQLIQRKNTFRKVYYRKGGENNG